jgi:hypothetical protein
MSDSNDDSDYMIEKYVTDKHFQRPAKMITESLNNLPHICLAKKRVHLCCWIVAFIPGEPFPVEQFMTPFVVDNY